MSFPKELLRETDEALCLFSAWYGGQQDAKFLRDAGLASVTCVDNDKKKLEAMKPAYPATWKFVEEDAFVAITRSSPGGFDVVTADPWSGDLDVQVRAWLPRLVAITRRVLILGCGTPWTLDTETALLAMGLAPRIIKRTESAVWVVVER